MALARPCDACGVMLEFHVGPNGKTLPLQRVRSVYVCNPDGTVKKAEVVGDAIFVSHFETCFKASSFSKPKTEERA